MGFGLQKFDAGTVTRRLMLTEISADLTKPITLIVRHAGSSNKLWDNFMLRQPAPAATKSAPATASAPEPAEQLAASRLAMRAENRSFTNTVLVETVIAGWEHVIEDDRPAEFTPDAALRFLVELGERCPDVWNRIILFATTLSNFRGATQDPVELGKE